MPWPARPTMAAGAPLLTEDLDAQNDEIELQSNEECTLTADATGKTNTTFASTNLARSVVANATYKVIGEMWYTAGTTGDIKFTLSMPAGASIVKASLLSGTAGDNAVDPATVYLGYDTSLSNLTAPGSTTATGKYCRFFVVFTTGSTAGTCTLQYAQATSDAGNATTLKAGSTFWVRRTAPV